jgi:hypothetical protein
MVLQVYELDHLKSMIKKKQIMKLFRGFVHESNFIN